ncbi:EamA family transporter [Desulforamulus aeronauticus]|uniref:Threonine/homoserine efflux transporter RhtA n=1 Tax=Desulforamulus aeronauticus DSM 10349 TaxID=1121421 RepID=A0A1M6SI77_9FIRM|nr:EamA family transporter [Desulforamulus aeronauticus]SHK44327.1 Threonine/homoserine efflux transporter RhtA [Desulforamulus aeronauticus DSM 10349]
MLYMLLVLLAGCSFGLLSPVVKLAYNSGLQPDQVVFTQFFMAWAMLTTIMLVTSRKRMGYKKAGKLALAGVSNGMAGLFFFLSLQTLPASIAIVIMFQFTWMGVLLEAIVDKKWPGKEKFSSVLVLVLGIVMAGGILEGEVKLDLIGVLLATLSAFAYSFYILFSGRVATNEPPINRSVWIITGAVLFSAFIYPPKFIIEGQITTSLIWFGLGIGLLGGVIPTFLLAKGVPQVGPGMATILCSSELPVALLGSALLLGERASILQLLGVLLILFGIAIPYVASNIKKHSGQLTEH